MRQEIAGIPERAEQMVRWSSEPEMQAFMEEHAHFQNYRLCAAFEKRFGFRLSRPQITLWRQVNGRTTKPSHGGGRASKPVGSEYVGKDGYVMYKFAEKTTVPGAKDNWKLKHVWVWEQANGPVPEGCNIYFADGNRRNFDPGNLVAVPKRVLGVLNNPARGYEWHDAESLRACIAHASLDVAITDKKITVPRTCKVCGREFSVDPASHISNRVQARDMRTCPSCLKDGRKSPYNGDDAGLAVCKVCGNVFKKSRPRRTRCDECIRKHREKPTKKTREERA